MNIVNEAIRRKKSAQSEGFPFDHVQVLFDDDNQSNLHNAFSKAYKHGIKIAFSRVCVEVWFLYHFTESVPPHKHSNAVEDALKKHWRDYKKPARNSWKKLEPMLAIAIDRCKKLIKKTKDIEYFPIENPYTDVFKLLIALGYESTKAQV